MPRIERVDVANEIFHVINRANARVKIFDNKKDYEQFEEILEEAVEKFNVNLFAYCIMPNHFHLVLSPNEDGELSRFMGWLTNTHTRRWHSSKKTIGQGHLYQGRYKSFLCQKENYLLTLLRYVERNAKRAKVVKNAIDWKWSSLWTRKNGSPERKKMLTEWPIKMPKDYESFVNESQPKEEVESIRKSTTKNIPFGNDKWVGEIVDKFNIGQTLRNVGRPKKNGG
jgi:putative transposase